LITSYTSPSARMARTKSKAGELEFVLEQLVNEIDHKYKYRYSSKEPQGSPESNDDYDCQNQQKQFLNTTIVSHVI
jgi:hypothetical protein